MYEKLVRDLQFPELERVLDSDKSAARLKKAIEGAFASYTGIPPVIRVNSEGDVRWRQHYPHYVSRHRVMKIPRAAEWFKQYYGIGTEESTYRDIAKRVGTSHETVRKNVYWARELLRQRHKHDLWYGAL